MAADDGPITGSRARFIALGILASRTAGLVRDKAIAFFFGASPHGDVWVTALRLPNLLQNLLGDQAMAAAFIPVYSRLLATGRREEAGRFAGAIFGLLLAVVIALVLLGVLLAPFLVAILNAGYLRDAARVAAGEATVDRYPLAVTATRVVFPMTGILVLAAWAQGVLASHRRFFLSYVAPVLWNTAIIAVLIVVAWGVRPSEAGNATLDRWVIAACVGGVVGALLQFLVQLPLVLRLTRELRLSLDRRTVGVGEALRAFVPAFLGRGVVQLSLYIDQFLATWLTAGTVLALGLAGRLYSLPISLFAMSVAASELPELARARGEEAAADAEMIQTRVAQALRQAAFVVAPSLVGYLAFGYLVVGFFRGGRFGGADQLLVYLLLAGYSLGLLAATISRLLQNTFYALGDTRTPALAAVVRLVIAATVSVGLMLPLDRVPVTRLLPGAVDGGLTLGGLGLALGAATAAWIELTWLRHALRGVLPGLRLPVRDVAGHVVVATLVAIPAAGLWWLVAARPLWLQVVLVPGSYAVLYLALARWRRVPELDLWLGRVRRR